MSQLDSIIKSMDNIETSIRTINGELGDLVARISVLESQMYEVLWLQRLLLGTIIVAIVGAVLGLVLKKKNAKS